MDKYKTNTAFNKWFSAIKLENLSVDSKKWIFNYNSYRKKLSFEAVLKLFLYAINEEKESLRDLSTSLINEALQIETEVTTISHTQLSRGSMSIIETLFSRVFLYNFIPGISHCLIQVSSQTRLTPESNNEVENP